MVTSKNGLKIESSEIGLAGEIIQSCTAIATRLLEKAYSPVFSLNDRNLISIAEEAPVGRHTVLKGVVKGKLCSHTKNPD